MALQGSGAISMSQIAAEFGGGAPHSLSEYYKNGSYVPSSVTVNTTVREPATGELYNANGSYRWGRDAYDEWDPYYVDIRWASVWILQNGSDSLTTYTAGGFTYYRGEKSRFIDRGKYGLSQHHYVYRTSGGASSSPVNPGIPTAGQISFSQFYGGRKR